MYVRVRVGTRVRSILWSAARARATTHTMAECYHRHAIQQK